MAGHSEWTVEQFARHYAETLASPANAQGQHVSPLFGISHYVMIAAAKLYSQETVDRSFAKAIKEKGI